jgi:hypothetical protein
MKGIRFVSSGYGLCSILLSFVWREDTFYNEIEDKICPFYKTEWGRKELQAIRESFLITIDNRAKKKGERR